VRIRIGLRHLLLAMVPIALAAAVVARFDRARTDARESQCHGNMFYVFYNLTMYRKGNGRFPPAVTLGADGKPMHSWRALAFRYAVSGPFRAGPVSYDLTQPWDSPGNLKAAKVARPSDFYCPNAQDYPAPFANYVVVVDRSGVSTLDLADANGPGLPPEQERILLIEDPGSTIPWTEPHDLAFEALDSLGSGHDPHGLGVVLADGSFRRLPRGEVIARLRRQWPRPGQLP
jgi:hypothetical protein